MEVWKQAHKTVKEQSDSLGDLTGKNEFFTIDFQKNESEPN